jgi:hypothetical protein
MSKQLAKDLSNLVETELLKGALPVRDGTRINIGSYSIKPTDEGYSVMSYKEKCIVAVTYSKVAALATAKLLAKNSSNKTLESVQQLDRVVAKHHTDCQFYKHTLKVATNPVTLDSTATRYDISKRTELEARDRLKSFIF